MIRGLCALLLGVVVVAGCTTDNGGLILKDLAPLSVPPADPALAELLPDDIRERGAVTAGSPLSSQPLYFRTGDTGEPTGLTVDFVATASAILGLRVEWLQLPYAGLPPALLSRKIDVAAAQFSPTPENLKAINVISLYRTATSVLMYKAARTWARPPHVVRVPRRVPLSRLNGATPTRAAMRWRLKAPNSGRSSTSVRAHTGPMPGTRRYSVSHSRQTGLARRVLSRSSSRAARR